LSEAPPDRAGRARIEVDLGALERNFRKLAAEVAPARVMAVVKADAYGHGAVAVARVLEPLGVAGLLVARAEEGVELRAAGARAPILVGSPVHPDELGLLARHDLAPLVSGLDQLDALERFASASGWRPAAHLKVDTGMNRLGVPLDAAPAVFERLRASTALDWIGLASHLADADHETSPVNVRQVAAFDELVESLDGDLRRRLTVHFANSAAALRLPRARHDLVRPGIALFGGVGRGALGLEPVLALRGRLVQVKELEAGAQVGYGGRWRPTRPSTAGVVGVGYADGYPWRAGDAAEALVGGRRVPVVGAVSMDLLTVDLTGAEAAAGDEVTLVGRDRDDEIRIAELAALSGTIAYEILCHLPLRLPRVWLGERSAGPPAAGEAA
jgi:alanine racemase